MIEKLSNKIIYWVGSQNSVIIHTIFFIVSILSYIFNVIDRNTILLILTTIVSIEAIYLSIFIQMSVNNQTKKLETVAEDVDEMQEDIEEMQEEDEEDDIELSEIKETMNKLMSEIMMLKKQLKK